MHGQFKKQKETFYSTAVIVCIDTVSFTTIITIADVDIASFADIGYTVDVSANDIPAVPVPASIILMGSALGLMGLWSRRRRSHTA